MIPTPPFQSLSESLELSSPQSPEVDWSRPSGGDRALSSPQSGVGSPRVSRASSPECRQPSSPLLRTKAPLARPRMSAQEQLERMRRNQACGLPLPRPTSPRLLTLGRTLSPAPRQPDMEQRPLQAEIWIPGETVSSQAHSLPVKNCPRSPRPQLLTRLLLLPQGSHAKAAGEAWPHGRPGGTLGRPLQL